MNTIRRKPAARTSRRGVLLSSARASCAVVALAALAWGLAPAQDLTGAVESRDAEAADAAGVGLTALPAPEGGGPASVANAGARIPPGLQSPSPGTPCYLLVRAGRAELEDPAGLDPLLDAARAAGLKVVVRLVEDGFGSLGPEPAGPAGDHSLADGWATMVGELARRAGDRVAAYQVFEQPASRHEPRAYAFLLKKAAVAIHSAGARVAIGSIGVADADWLRDLFAADVAPYADALAAAGAAQLDPVRRLRDDLHPRAALWITDEMIESAAFPGGPARTYLEAQAAGVAVVLFETARAEAEAGDGAVRPGYLLSWLRALFPSGMAAALPAALPFDPGNEARVLAFLDARRRDGLAAYRSIAQERNASVSFVVKSPMEEIEILNPEDLSASPVADSAPSGSALSLSLRADYLLLRYRLAATGLPLQSMEVRADRELTAEEIIAKEREFRASQEGRLRHYEARATVSIHYRVASLAQSVDVLTENNLYVHDGKQDYQQTALFVDGARWRGKSPPYLPFIQPEKVQEIPLDIVLDEGYRYRLEGREQADGRDCYVLAFAPASLEGSFYEGRIFIDTAVFARVRMEAVQGGLKDPLRSNHVTYRFEPVSLTSGEYWLPVTATGQMVFEVLGQNLVVEREARFTGFAVNEEQFLENLAGAHASGLPLFRETDEGYYRLDARGGQEQLTSASIPRNAFVVMGINVGLDADPGLPFAGVNFFDFNFRNTGTQLDIAWAGPFADISWTNPRLTHPAPGRRPLALTLRGTFEGLAARDKLATMEGTESGETIDVLHETVRAALALPMGNFARWSLEPRAGYMNFTRRSKTDKEFVLPADGTEVGTLLRLEFNRSGYMAGGWGEVVRRSRWTAWGLPGTPFSPDDRDFTRFGLDLRKSFYTTTFQKIDLSLSGFDGRGLDRFSRFELGDFRAASVSGYGGSGIHFDRGLVVATGYSFSIRKEFRVDIGLDHAWVQSEEDFGPGYERAMGAGIHFQFSGPWSTLCVVRINHGITTTVPDISGGGDVRVLFIRSFDRWSRKARP